MFELYDDVQMNKLMAWYMDVRKLFISIYE